MRGLITVRAFVGRCIGALGAGVVAVTIGVAACSDSGNTPSGDASACRQNEVQCGGACTDTSRDHGNCGACGTTCKQGELCAVGRCATSCGGGTVQCGNTCTSTQNDPQNCGSCGTVCKANEFCSSGSCSSRCGLGTTACGQACVDLQVDSSNCGGCGAKCADGKVCNNGSCDAACGQGSVLCGGGDAGSPYCAHTQTDNLNCGACYIACGLGRTCANGACANACAAPDGGVETLCAPDGGLPYCANLESDNANCGACGVACAPDAGGATCCGAACVDVNTSKKNCGACGKDCGPASCLGGQCQPICYAMNITQAAANISAPDTGWNLGAGDWTIETWVKAHDSFTGGVIFTLNQGYLTNDIRFQYDNTTGKLWCNTYSGSCPCGKGTGNLNLMSQPINDGKWHHAACVRNGGAAKMFVDGAQVDSDIISTSLVPASGIAFGRPSGYPSYAAAPVLVGPFRFSSVARYMSAFVPAKTWPIDGSTVTQYLTSSPFANNTLTDEAGGNNTSSSATGTSPSNDTPCP